MRKFIAHVVLEMFGFNLSHLTTGKVKYFLTVFGGRYDGEKKQKGRVCGETEREREEERKRG